MRLHRTLLHRRREPFQDVHRHPSCIEFCLTFELVPPFLSLFATKKERRRNKFKQRTRFKGGGPLSFGVENRVDEVNREGPSFLCHAASALCFLLDFYYFPSEIHPVEQRTPLSLTSKSNFSPFGKFSSDFKGCRIKSTSSVCV